MLTAKNIFKNYGDLKVLNNISLEIKASEVVSIVGASGAGKSTLLHILGTLDTPDQGEVILDNTNITSLNSNQLSKLRNEKIGFVFQFHNLLSELTAFENICLPAWVGKKEAENNATELLKTLNIYDRKDHYPSQLSGGEQQRVAVARALINKPKIVFADEPSGNLDTKNAEELHKLFFEIRNKYDCSIVIITHNLELARRSDRIIELKDGQIINE